jgi:TolA-binding protein
VLNLACSATDGDFAIELNEPARVREQQVQGRRRLFLSWTVIPQQEELVFGFTVKALAGDGPRDPEKAAEEAEKARQYGKAWSLLSGFLPKIKDAAQKERVEAKVKRLEESEKREWDEVLAQAFQADFSGRPDLLRRAQESLDLHLTQWRGANVEGKAQKVREDLRRQGDVSAANDVDRPRKILAQAKKLAESGKRSVAEAVLRALLAKYPASDVADEAKQLLGTLGQ